MHETSASPHRSAPLTVSVDDDKATWDADVLALGGHPLQLWGWGEAKSHGGNWRPVHLRIQSEQETVGLAQVLVRKLPPFFQALSYVPRGPVLRSLSDASAVSNAITEWARTTVGGVGITFEPQWPEADAEPRLIAGGQTGRSHVLIARTMIIDLTKSEDELLAGMTRTTRQGVRRSAKAGLDYREVATDAEFDACLELYRGTAERAGFDLHADAYYRTVREALGTHAPTFAAFDGDAPVAFLMLAASATTSFELYAGADDVGRHHRANYSLKWAAILAMKERGLTQYDVNGLLNDGISDFKRSFAQHEDHWVGTIDVPFSAARYRAWNDLLPVAKKGLRRAVAVRRDLRERVGR